MSNQHLGICLRSFQPGYSSLSSVGSHPISVYDRSQSCDVAERKRKRETAEWGGGRWAKDKAGSIYAFKKDARIGP